MNENPIELANIYLKNAFDRCKHIHVANGDGKEHDYRIARIGIGDGLWVDNEGVVYICKNEKFDSHHLILSLFDNLLDKDFRKTILIPDFEHPDKLKTVKTHQFGERNMMVGEDGVLYLVGKHEKRGLFGKAKSSSRGINSKLNSGLEHRAYEIAKLGYDSSCLSIARGYIEKSNLSNTDKSSFSAIIDTCPRQIDEVN